MAGASQEVLREALCNERTYTAFTVRCVLTDTAHHEMCAVYSPNCHLVKLITAKGKLEFDHELLSNHPQQHSPHLRNSFKSPSELCTVRSGHAQP